jgi:hypothetical protein
MNPLPQTIRGRDERRDRSLSVLEICREFVSWRGDRFAAIAAEIFLVRSYLPPFADCERKVRFFWFARCSTRK